MNDVVIRAEGLGKRYRIGGVDGSYTALRDVLTRGVGELASRAFGRGRPAGTGDAQRPSEAAFWALREADFEIARGDVVGLIGRNGAGKSTLLKLLSRITEPTEGRVTIQGRVASLLEVGTGFHPELTGRENIYLNGAILGMGRAEIRRKFDEIVAFAEIERFLDTPVKRYSSGMYIRLAFAVAAHLEAEILVVDEVLAVGDAAFQAKCLGKMGQVASDGRTVLFVSHNLSAVERLCRTAMLLDGGRIVERGPVGAVSRLYLDQAVPAGLRADARKVRSTGDVIRITAVECSVEGAATRQVRAGQACEFRIVYECLAPNRLRVPPSFSLLVCFNGQRVANLWSDYLATQPPLPEGGIARCVVPRWPFREGEVRIDVYAHVGAVAQDWIEDVLSLSSLDGPFYGDGPLAGVDQGILFLEHAWAAAAERA